MADSNSLANRTEGTFLPGRGPTVSQKPALPSTLRKCPYCRRHGTAMHIQNCGQQLVNCPKCGMELEMAKLAAHEAYTCKERAEREPCVGCGEIVLFTEYQKHLIASCGGSSFNCSGCGETFLSPHEYNCHISSSKSSCFRPFVSSAEPKPSSSEKVNVLRNHADWDPKKVSVRKVLLPDDQHSPVVDQLVVKPRSDPRERVVCITEQDCRSRPVMTTEEARGQSPNRHPSRFMKRATSSSPERAGLMVREKDSFEFSGKFDVPQRRTVPRPMEAFRPIRTSVTVNATSFVKYSREFMRDLKKRREGMSESQQRQGRIALPQSPQFATNELRKKRVEMRQSRSRSVNMCPGRDNQQNLVVPSGDNVTRNSAAGTEHQQIQQRHEDPNRVSLNGSLGHDESLNVSGSPSAMSSANKVSLAAGNCSQLSSDHLATGVRAGVSGIERAWKGPEMGVRAAARPSLTTSQARSRSLPGPSLGRSRGLLPYEGIKEERRLLHQSAASPCQSFTSHV
ncbi:hypothetical protein ERJ75_000358400 [Trypanosoma vivax]|nr:hypothetical protein ERJ75_000358400 [Trypanosoma vivax]